MIRLATTVGALFLAATLIGCGGGQDEAARAAEAQQRMEQERRLHQEAMKKAEAERQAQAALTDRRRSFIEVSFVKLDDEGRVLVSVTNPGERDIDDVRGGFQALDADGQTIAAAGYTEGVTGDIYLAAGQSREQHPFVSAKPAVVAALEADPTAVQWVFEARAITYGDGAVEEGLEE